MMAYKKTVSSLIALLMVLTLSLSLFAVGISAADEATDAAEATEEVTEAADETTAAPADTTAAPSTDKKDEKNAFGLGFWISTGVLVVLVGVAVYFCVKNRESVGKWWRGIKSELKKIVWMPWGEVRKNTVVVLVVVISLGLVIALLDYTFWNGIIALRTIFG